MIRARFWKIGTIALLTGVPGCGSDQVFGESEHENVRATDIPELGIATEDLGAIVSDCNNGSGIGGADNYESASKTMNMTLDGGANVFSVIGNAVTVNGWACYDKNGVALTTTNVKKMNITTSGSGDKIVFDLLPGSFGSIFSTTGGVTVTFTNAGDEFAVRGNTAANKMKVGETGGDVYVEVSGDTKADIKLTGGAFIPESLTFLLGDGNDSLEAIEVTTISASHIDSAATALAALSANYSLIVYGGEGDDTIRGGLGDDTLYGNAGNDTFLSATTDDGSDTFIGGSGTDTVSYAGRTNPIIADINPVGFVAVGNDLVTTVTLDGVLDYNLDIRVDDDDSGVIDGDDATVNILAEDATSPEELVTALNADPDTAVLGLTFGLDPRNRLVIKGSEAFEVVAGQSESLLGIAAGTYTTTSHDADDGEAGEGDDIQEDIENLIGGAGADTLTGNENSNVISGGAGNDSISGGSGNSVCTSDVDVLNGGDGNDTFVMGPVADCGDEVNGNAGTDKVDYQFRTAALTITVDGSANDGLPLEGDNVKTDVEIIVGGAAGDTITGGNGNETIHGGAGNDIINGGGGNDTLIGNAGNDILNGGAGDDLFIAEGDDDVFVNYLTVTTDDMGAGADVMNGGPGIDKVSYASRVAPVFVTLCTDVAAATGAPVTSPIPAPCADSDGSAGSLTGTEDISALDYSAETNYDLVIAVGAVPYTVNLDGAADKAAVAAAINGEAALAAVITADATGNFLVLSMNDKNSTAVVTIDAATTDDVAADLGLVEGATISNEGDKNVNIEWLVGGSGDDVLTGHTAGETIEGGDGNDTINGGAGDDTLYGDGGNDTINGGDGNDTLFGGGGIDQAVGGNGDADVCEFDASDVVTPVSCEFVN